MNLPIYLDNQATTPVDPRVLNAMLPYFSEVFGNSGSVINRHGQRAREAVEYARAQIAKAAGAEAGEVILTSGATESINMVIQGLVRGKTWRDLHIVTCVTEHSAVLGACAEAEARGARVVRLPVNPDGILDLGHLEAAVKLSPTLVSLMHANNEIGVCHPVKEIARICRDAGVLLHIDAAQSYGKLPLQMDAWGIDLLSISGHKIYAPKGVGALFVRRQLPPIRLRPLTFGGGQERGFRAGTLNVPGIVALGEAARICMEEMASEPERIGLLRDTLLGKITAGVDGVTVNGPMEFRLPGNLNLSFEGIAPQSLLPALQDKISVSSGSACTSGSTKPSHVLAALGVSDELAMASLRFGIGRFNTAAEIDFAAEAVIEAVLQLRQELHQ